MPGCAARVEARVAARRSKARQAAFCETHLKGKGVCHVLIIEDEPLIAMLVRDLLEEEGATSFSFAATQDDAVAAAISEPPALITSDVKLVEGTGPLAIAAIHHHLGPVPVIFITGTPAECQPCNPPGRVLTKPFNNSELASAFHEMAQV
jgi:CheY-like chemotaxis protein